MKKKLILTFIQSLLSGISLLWLFLEAYNALEKTVSFNLTFIDLIIYGVILGVIWFVINGYFIQEYLRNSITIRSNFIPIKINIFYGDIFKQDGCTAIAVNDCFDSKIGDEYIAPESLHGQMLDKFWPTDKNDWYSQVEKQLKDSDIVKSKEVHSELKSKKYKIGTTVFTKSGIKDKKFLCTAFMQEDINNLTKGITLTDFRKAVNRLLKVARSRCKDEVLNIPLIGSGLLRLGIKNNIIIDLLIIEIFNESKRSIIADEINIVLNKNKKREINLANILEDWS